MLKDRIKKLRKVLDLTQQEFANRLGISRGNIATYETREGSPGSSVISLICREFNVSEKWLRTGEGEMFNQSVENTVDRLCAELHASELESGIIRAYFRIDPRIREPFMQRMIQEMQSEYATMAPAPAEPDKFWQVRIVEQKTPTPVSEDGPKNADEESLMKNVQSMSPGQQELLFNQYNQARLLREQQKGASAASVPPAADDKAPESKIPDPS
jgi:transcriptional regulator with XRE-family HTH domain